MVSNSDNAVRPFAKEINETLERAIEKDPSVVIGGQLIKYGFGGMTTGLYEKYPDRFITYSVSEELMNSSAMGLALAGKRVVMCHVRLDFLLCGMNSLFNHIPIWWKKGHKLPITILAQGGGGLLTGQGAQHSKDITFWFQKFEGWRVFVPKNPEEAVGMLNESIFGDQPALYVVHRRLFFEKVTVKTPAHIGLCGASRRHTEAFYGKG